MTPLIFGLGVPELLIILAVVLLLFGGSRLAGLGKSTGRALKEFKEETKGLKGAEGQPGGSTPITGNPYDVGTTPTPQAQTGQPSGPVYGQVPPTGIADHQAPQSGAPYGQVPQGGAPYGQVPQGGAPYGQAPQGGGPYGQAPQGGGPYGQAPQGGAPYGQAPQDGTGTPGTPGTHDTRRDG